MRLIGRGGDLRALEALLERGKRIVTILGPAGMGKTSLALQLADRTGGSCFVDLTRAATVADIAVETARALERCTTEGSSFGLELPQLSAEALARALAARPRLLLVLDNLEHLLPGAAPIVAAWSRAAPELSIVSTSRETLRISGETIYELAPLPEAVELFVERAREAEPAFLPGAAELAIIAEIAARLERIPLAIELAAARVAVLSLRELLARLSDPFALLSEGPRDRSPRQVTMDGAIEWSWRLLSAIEQRALAVASVFRGGFLVEAFEAVLADRSAFEIAQALRAKSFLRRDDGSRLGMYEVIRAWVRGKLDDVSLAAIEAAHARYYVGVATTKDLAAERENLAAVLAHAALRRDAELDTLGLRAAVLLDALSAGDGITESQSKNLAVLLARQPRGEAQPAAARPGGAPLDPAPLGAAHLAQAGRLLAIARLDEAEHAAREALQLAETNERAPHAAAHPATQTNAEHSAQTTAPAATQHPAQTTAPAATQHAAQTTAPAATQHPAQTTAPLAAQARARLASIVFALGRIEESVALAQQAIAAFQALGDQPGLAQALALEAGALSSLNRGDEALDRFEHARAIARTHGDRRVELSSEAGIAFRWLELGRYEPARKHYQRCLELARDLGAKRMALLITGYLGLLELDHGRLLDALEHTTIAVAEARERGETRAEGVFSAVTAAVRAALGEVDEAERAYGAAEALLLRHPFFLRVAEIHRGHVELAKSREAAAHGDLARWKKLRDAARARLQLGDSAIEQSDDARIALRILSRALDRDGGTPDLKDSEPRTEELAVAPDGSWFQTARGSKVELSRRGALKSLVALLAQRRESTPGEPIAIDELLAAGWPGEKLIKSAALNRLHVALATLRSLGLKEALERRGEGYLFPTRINIKSRDRSD